jgi:hypothetical protein
MTPLNANPISSVGGRERRLKTQVFVLIPFSVGTSALLIEVDNVMKRHRRDVNGSAGGRFDYLVGSDGCFNDPVAEGRLPAMVRQTLHRHLCEVERLPTEFVPGALVTPDGCWHDLTDDGWRMIDEPSPTNEAAFARWRTRYSNLIAANPYCWVVELWAHS